jgi:diguanylate cyclase (GGDEF)-like protein
MDRRPGILAIDDTPANLLTLGAMLSGEFDLQMATSGVQGLELARAAPPDLILLDVTMPEMDGYETCQRLKADPLTRDVPIIFVTALAGAEQESRGLELGAVDYITKPLNPVIVRARVRTHITLKKQADQLRAMAFVDGLTGLANRRRFDEALLAEWRVCRRNGLPLSLIMVDIDYFKIFNDTYGHQAGDVCLQAVAEVLRRGMGRPHDLAARYGGEEFVCLMPGSDLDGALAKAESMREAIQGLGIPHKRSSVAGVVTVSLGVGSCFPEECMAPEQLLAVADAELYVSKSAGRNQSRGLELSEDRPEGP